MVRVHPGLLRDSICMTEASGPCKPAGSSLEWQTLVLCPRRGARPSPPPCHGGDRGFESHRGRLRNQRRGTVRKRQSGEAQTFVNLWVRLPLVPLLIRQIASAGHWRAPVPVKHPPVGSAGSTPARRTDRFLKTANQSARSSIGIGRWPLKPQRRVRFPHGPITGKGTSRAGRNTEAPDTSRWRLAWTYRTRHQNGQVVQLVDTRRSERRAHSGLGVRLSPWSLEWSMTTTQGGQCPVEPHKLQAPGATPGPATDRTVKEGTDNDRVRKSEKRRCRERRDFVGSTPTSVNSPHGEGPKSKVQGQKAKDGNRRSRCSFRL
jgi:hypothetical protein